MPYAASAAPEAAQAPMTIFHPSMRSGPLEPGAEGPPPLARKIVADA